MATKPAHLRAESHAALGAAIQKHAGLIIERWAARALEEQPGAGRVHHQVLLDHFPTFLWDLGRSLVEAEPADHPCGHCRPADDHGEQRWQVGWSVTEVVRDYQLLRLVLTEFLQEALDRPLRSREVMALDVAIDDAIASSVAAYVECREANGGPPSQELFDILGVLGHELRNPLAPIGNALHVMGAAADEPATVEKARLLIGRQLQVLARLVEDLMDVPRLLRGKMTIRQDRLDLVDLVRHCADDCRPAFDAVGLRLAVELPGSPVWTTGDATRLAQVVCNLLNNAQKFSPPGGEVRVRVVPVADRPAATISVRDTGIGIDAAFLPRIFDAFVQADRTIDRSRGGLGLGLALAKGLVELHGGTIRAVSDGPGTGAEFIVELPLPPGPPAEMVADAVPDAPAATYRVLIIEDNRDSAESLQLYLELLGHEVAVAFSGAAGLDLARTLRPDVVVSDIGLPGMSGYALCAELRADPALAGVRAIALSGHASDADREQCLKAGFDAHLVKPVDPNVLVRHFSRPATP
jgi:signal transduction histidine kinase